MIRTLPTILSRYTSRSSNRCQFIQKLTYSSSTRKGEGSDPESMFERLNWDRLMKDNLLENLQRRKETANVDKLRQLWNRLQKLPIEAGTNLKRDLIQEALRIPNDTHKASIDCGSSPQVIHTFGRPPSIKKPKQLHELCEAAGLLKTTNLGDIVGSRGYILKGFLAELEQALIRFTMEVLQEEGFQFVSVPDLLHSHVIESCGFPVNSDRNMVYEIETNDGEEPIYLSGTSEMAMAGYLSNRTFLKSQLPLKLAAYSRCFRAETSRVEEERGIYRVHNFGKVEMFGVTGSETGMESEELYQYFCQLQERLYSDLGLHFRVMEMSPNELGSSAYRKCDIEAWMPGRKQFGEISSCSNCTDYQSRRLNIRYENSYGTEETKFVHTLNGTACAIPRMLIAVVESYQTDDGSVALPPVLQKYMHSNWASSRKETVSFLKSKGQQENVVIHYDPWRR